jgi:ubiquinone/menaquinone biosynthesis C-methylase UbiE
MADSEEGSVEFKNTSELAYWLRMKENEPVLLNDHYKFFYTTAFGLEFSFYNNKRILDIGCGPRGSLEWADTAQLRVGLDPLASRYCNELDADKHKMTYINSGSENIPFPDNYFDVIISFNSLDHVDDIDETVNEIIRSLADGGTFLLITEIDHEPTPCEPHTLGHDILDSFKPLVLQSDVCYKKSTGVFQAIEENVPYLPDEHKTGILVAKFVKATSEVPLSDGVKTPVIEDDSVWKHKEHNGVYKVIGISNTSNVNSKHPAMVVYRGVSNGALWTNSVEYFLNKMDPIDESVDAQVADVSGYV